MKKRVYSIISMILIMCIFVGLSLMTPVSAADSSRVRNTLNEILEDFPVGSYFTTDGKKESPGDLKSVFEARGIDDTGYDQSYTCVAFAKYAWAKLFGHNITAKRIEIAGGRAGVSETWKDAQIGDLVYFYEQSDLKVHKNETIHAAIIWNVSETGVTLLDCNFDKTNQIDLYTVQFGGWGWPKGYCRIYHAADYEKASGNTVNTGTDKQAASTLTIIPASYPTDTLKAGKSFWLTGTITSNYMITEVKSEVIDSNGRVMLVATQAASSKNFSIANSKVNKNLKFADLPDGTYFLRYTATDNSGNTVIWGSPLFKVGNGGTTTKTVTITFDPKGGSVSTRTKNVTVGFTYGALPTPTREGYTFNGWYYDDDEQGVCAKVTESSIVDFKEDTTLYAVWSTKKCSTHTKGSYLWYEAAHPHYNYYTCSACGEKFTDGTTAKMDGCASCVGDSTLKISMTSYPTGTHKKGSTYSLEGTITSNYDITSVVGYILNASGEEADSYQDNVNVKSYAVRSSGVDHNLKFGELAVGTYTLKISATDASGKNVTWTSGSFTVTSGYDTNYSSYTTPSGTSDYAYWNGSGVVTSGGTTTAEIKWMQAALNYCIEYKGLNASYLTVDGSFGPASKAAAVQFQKAFGLTADGKFGPATISKMIDVLAGEEVSSGEEISGIETYALCWPVPTSVYNYNYITSEPGPRTAPVAGASVNHKGVDIAVAAGSSVLAVADGVVIDTGYGSKRGNYVAIYHEEIGLTSVYQHLSERYVSEGDYVSKGELIAKSGATGNVSGAHLHFELVVTSSKPQSGVECAWVPGAMILNGHYKNETINYEYKK